MAKKKVSPPAPDGTAAAALDGLTEEILPQIEKPPYFWRKKLADFAGGKALLARDRQAQVEVIREAIHRLVDLEAKCAAYRGRSSGARFDSRAWDKLWHPRWVMMDTVRSLLRRELPLAEADVIHLLEWPLKNTDPEDPHEINPISYPLPALASAAESFAEANEVSDPFRAAIEALSERLLQNTTDKECRKTAERLEAIMGGGPLVQVQIQPGEAWSDAARADLARMKGKAARAWNTLLLHCQAGGRSKYNERWRAGAEPLLAAVGCDSLKEHALRWFPLVDRPRTQPYAAQHPYEPDPTHLLIPSHVELLRGLVWCCGLRSDAELARALARLAISAYRKVPGKGPRLVSLGNACITALGLMPGPAPIGQLALLEVKVKFGTARKEIAKAFDAVALREGLPRDEIEELAVPSYGMEEVGRLYASFGDYQAELHIDGARAALHWLKDDRPVKSVPAAVRKQHPEEYRELQATLKDISAMLPAQRERIDALFLAQKSWPLADWRQRYLDHPLVGAIARRLLWTFTTRGKTADGAWSGDDLVGLNGKPLKLTEKTTVSLWHPIDRPVDEVLAWRDWLERREVVQPFKQAHREVYVLTDAERRTATYSNRFAAHVLKQHQFHALCAARGWKNQLRLMVDASYPPASRLLPPWGLRAEYWIEGAGDEYGRDTNQSGAYLYLTTDQVRFYALDAPQLHAHAGGGGYGRWDRDTDEPLRLDAVPPLVFSEIMRDVDLFVGVASVGNDPSWADGGPEGRYRDYWQSYSFGELSATAQTRRTLLERLLPRLRIADRCSLSERFLHVQGELRGYKIHLGSGNILMTPNDQYLCIVPRQTTADSERLFLPFEGDNLLSVILSKAFLLAEDAKITDPTITSQLKG